MPSGLPLLHVVNYQERLSRTFAALVDPTRRAILARLEREEAGTSVSELAEPFAIRLPAVMKVWRAAQYVTFALLLGCACSTS